jgi:hypothetical protein
MTPREWMLAILAGVFLLGLLMFWRAQRSRQIAFDALDLIMENGRVSRIALAFMVAFAVTTWIMVYMTIQGKLTEGLFGLYGALWVGPLVAKVVFNKNDMPGSVTSTTTVQKTTEVIPP